MAILCSQAPLSNEFDCFKSLMSPRIRNSLLLGDCLKIFYACLRCNLIEFVLSK